MLDQGGPARLDAERAGGFRVHTDEIRAFEPAGKGAVALQLRLRRYGRVIPVCVFVLGACSTAPSETGPRSVRPGAPGEATREVVAADAAQARSSHVSADVEFMRSMIGHHEQALVMTTLVAGRSEREDIALLARRIEASQADEIARMQRWLEVRGESAPVTGGPAALPHASHQHGEAHGATAHGMLSADELAHLAAASGAAFDRLFLESMIRHHEGALTMVEELFAVPGAGREPELFQFASHVDADQRMEIARMRRLLNTILQ